MTTDTTRNAKPAVRAGSVSFIDQCGLHPALRIVAAHGPEQKDTSV